MKKEKLKQEIIEACSKLIDEKLNQPEKIAFKGDGTIKTGERIIEELEKMGGKTTIWDGNGTGYYFIKNQKILFEFDLPTGYTLKELPKEEPSKQKEPYFKVGEWYVESNDEISGIAKYSGKGKCEWYGTNGLYVSRNPMTCRNTWRPATPEQVESILIQHYEANGWVRGAKYSLNYMPNNIWTVDYLKFRYGEIVSVSQENGGKDPVSECTLIKDEPIRAFGHDVEFLEKTIGSNTNSILYTQKIIKICDMELTKEEAKMIDWVADFCEENDIVINNLGSMFYAGKELNKQTRKKIMERIEK